MRAMNRFLAGWMTLMLFGGLMGLPMAAADHECDKTVEINCVEENSWDGAICWLWIDSGEPLLPFKDGCYGIDSDQQCHTDVWFNCTYDDHGNLKYCFVYLVLGVATFC